MKKQFIILGFLVLIMLVLTGCASKEDKILANEVSLDIDSIGVVSLDKADMILAIKKTYDQLSDKQKELIKNYSVLDTSIAELDELAFLESIQSDPTYTLTKKDLVGIWEETNPDSMHVGYYYVTSSGYIYYIASKSFPSQFDFSSDHILCTSYELGNYNRTSNSKVGKFYCSPLHKDFHFSIVRDVLGKMTMTVQGSGVGTGTYEKSGNKVDIEPKQCQYIGCKKMAASTGDTNYCESHSAKCLECGCYINDDAMYCLNCLMNALRNIKNQY